MLARVYKEYQEFGKESQLQVKASIVVSSPLQATKMLLRQLLTVCRFSAFIKSSWFKLQDPRCDLDPKALVWVKYLSSGCTVSEQLYAWNMQLLCSLSVTLVSCAHLHQIHRIKPFSLLILTLYAPCAASSSPVRSRYIVPCEHLLFAHAVQPIFLHACTATLLPIPDTSIPHSHQTHQIQIHVICSAPKYAHAPLRLREPAHPFSHSK